MIKFYEKIEAQLESKEGFADSVWINISPNVEIRELESVSAELEIPLDFLTDSLDINERSRYEREDDFDQYSLSK